MRMVDVILKKREGKALSDDEIKFFVNGYVDNKIPDYQISALFMAIVFQGMNKDEIVTLTKIMRDSGDIVDLSDIKGIKVDKHSTGGVGDKTSLVLGPMIASLGVKVAKMSGRGLGHTGGTLDKLESIPGFNIYLDEAQFKKQVSEIGISIIGQTKSLVPADKKMYALRDVTATVESLPLIASSIMSKKLASGSDAILLDVKFGSGAFMKTYDDALKLAKLMCEIGNSLGKDTRAVLTSMDQPLGKAIGNSLEVKEAINTLKGNGPKDFYNLCLESGAVMLMQAELVNNKEDAIKMLEEVIANGKAYNKFLEMVKAQGGDISYVENIDKFETSKHIIKIKSTKQGYVKQIDALQIGLIAMKLGAGRETFDDKIDMSAGIILDKKVGDKVEIGEVLCELHTNKDNYLDLVSETLDAYNISEEFVDYPLTVHAYIK